jgi:hypothetical protein
VLLIGQLVLVFLKGISLELTLREILIVTNIEYILDREFL